MQCPYIDKKIPNEKIYKPINHKDVGGSVNYIYYQYKNPNNKYELVQFCEFKGRKSDVLECLIESEWENCLVYKCNKKFSVFIK